MYPWNSPASGASAPNLPPPPRGGMIATSASPSPAYPVQQLRWLPSMVADPRPSQHTVQHTGLRIPSNSSPNQHPPNPNPNPNLASQHHQQQQPVSSTVGVALSDGQDSSPGNERHTGLAATSASAGGYSAYTSSNVPASVSAPAPAPARQRQSQNQMQMPMPIGVPMPAQPQPQPQSRPRLSTSTLPADDEEEEGPATVNSRRPGKRLTTKEEVLLFEICNAHAAEFGQRSNLCNWWRRVTDDFIRQHGQPYSWHSVRRKVELATKQRIKFLEGKDGDDGVGGGDDVSNPRWRAGVDAWIPTWQRWEQAEAKRIEKRDSRKGRRKRKDRSWEDSAAADGLSDGGLSGGGGEGSNSNGNRHTQSGAGAGAGRPGTQSQSQQIPPPAAPVKLPPGFDSMFQSQPHTPARNGTHNPPTQNQDGYQTTYSPPSGAAPMDSVMMGAMLETLGKLNKRLDATPANPDPRVSPVTSALVSNAESPSQPQPQGVSGPEERKPSLVPLTAESWRKLKEELRQEMQADVQRQVEKDREGLEEKLDSVQRTQEMILDMLRQEP